MWHDGLAVFDVRIMKAKKAAATKKPNLVVVPPPPDKTGLVNVDFADVRTIMAEQGMALMGAGAAVGRDRAAMAAKQAISSPLLEDTSIDGAQGILVNVTGGDDLTLMEMHDAITLIQSAAHPDANIIFGAVIDQDLGDEIRITVVATGFDRVSDSDGQVDSAQDQMSQLSQLSQHGHAMAQNRAPQREVQHQPEPPPPLPVFDDEPFVQVGQRGGNRFNEIGSTFADSRPSLRPAPAQPQRPWETGGRSLSDVTGVRKRPNPFASNESEFGAGGYPRKR